MALSRTADDVDPAGRLTEPPTRLIAVADTGVTLAGFDDPPSSADADATAPYELAVGDRLGPWRLVAEIGRGGMGGVFLAERVDGHYEQQVAVKLLRGRADARLAPLFARERQILASLNHPNIARLLDGGTTPAGRPYLVMEYVQGVRIDTWCRRRELGLDARLALVRQVAEAVAEAHRRLIVHCDIKPDNVLVTAEGRAMLLDFGVARLLDLDDGATGVSGLTPDYASPEQHAGGRVTAASDVWALGRLLEELIAPLPPPTRRRREVQAIVARATLDDPAARYGSAGELIADLKRFSRHMPLAALPRRPLYVAAKLVRRRWPWLAVGGAVAAMAAAFTAGLVHERDRAFAAERAARDEAATVQRVSDLLLGIFESADPANAGRADLDASTLLQHGREQADAALADQPALQARLRAVIGRAYENMGRGATALALYDQALAAERRLDHPDAVAALLGRRAMALADMGRAVDAEQAARQSLALREDAARSRPGDAQAALDLAESQHALGRVLRAGGRYDEARARFDAALQTRRRLLAAPDMRIAALLHELGQLDGAVGDLASAERRLAQALAMKRQLVPPPALSIGKTRQALATTLAAQRRFDEAEAMLREGIAEHRHRFGANAAGVGEQLNELASLLQSSDRPARADEAYRDAIAVAEANDGRGSMAAALAINNLATLHDALGDPRAEGGYRDSLAIRALLLREGDPMLDRGRLNLGRWLVRAGRVDEGAPLIERAAAAALARHPAGHERRQEAMLALTELRLSQGDLGDAERLLDAVAGVAPGGPKGALRVALLRQRGRLLAARGDAAGARTALVGALDAARSLWPREPSRLARFGVDAADAELAAGRTSEARRLLDTAQPAIDAMHPQAPLRAQAERLRRRLDA